VALPTLRPLGRLDLVLFDLRTGLWVASRHLRAHLGLGGLLRVLWGLLRRATSDPLAGRQVPGWVGEREGLVHHQLRPALQLDQVLEQDLGLSVEARLPVLRDVIAETGAAFVATHARGVDLAAWRSTGTEGRARWAQGLTARFFNARIEAVETAEEGLAFTVTACRFATLVRELGRPHLAPLFCEADRIWFERTQTPVALERRGTLGQHDPVCDFRLTIRGP